VFLLPPSSTTLETLACHLILRYAQDDKGEAQDDRGEAQDDEAGLKEDTGRRHEKGELWPSVAHRLVEMEG
jgi:hypothetical protein